jgi:hypothetical protein
MTWTRKDTVAAIVALVLVFCAVPTFFIGRFLAHILADPRACKSPAYEPALITAYAAEPLLTAGIASLPTDQPQIRHFCDLGTDHIHNLSYTEVTYRHPAGVWRAVPVLLAVYQSTAVAEGWVYSGNRDDSDIAAIEFCKAVRGTRTTLTIAMLAANVAGGATVEAREIVSVPGDQDCPFQSDLWGPSYFPP